MGVDLEVPDHTTISRRSADLQVSLASLISDAPIDLIIDSSGLAIVGEGEWAAAKHGGNGRRGWKKLHLGVDDTGEIVAQVLTASNVDDGTVGVENTFFRFKTVIGDRLRARTIASQETEAATGCNALNRMRALGRPASVKVAR